MADLNKFEQMLERLVNEDREGAQELFHDIVVEKSRSIYESLLESDVEDEDDEDEVEEGEYADDEDEVEEDFNLDEFEVDGNDDMMGGDATDDMISDLGGEDDEDGEFNLDTDSEGSEEGDVEDRVVDLEDALDELKAEFEKMMGGEGDDEGDDEGDMDFGNDDTEDDTDEESEDESFQFENKSKTSGEEMREYVEKVSGGHGAEKKGSGDNGANTKSAVASPNKMGSGSSQNIARSDTNDGGEHAGLGDLNAKDQDAGNINKPGGKAAKSQKPVGKGHGAEKKGSGESGAYNKPIIGQSKKK